jgi:tetratricopeptide (TPR) repeat protein
MQLMTPCIAIARHSLALVSLLLPLFAGVASAGDRESVLQLRAGSLEAEGRCQEAIELARQAHLDGILDARIGLVAGRCEVRLLRYSQALSTLDEAKALPPQLAEIDLYRGIALYHLEDFEAARRALDAARGELQGNALLDLYTGLLRLQRNEPREAALLLERARRADANAVEPVASFYAFLAWRSVDEDARAKAALERVRQTDPEGPWVAEAERILTRRHLRSRSDSWAALQAGMEYDSNVMLRGRVGPGAGEIPKVGDWRGVWSVDGGIELLRTEVWSGGLVAAYTGMAHIDLERFDLERFDVHFPTAGAWIDREFRRDTTVRLRYDYGYAWVDENSFVQTHDWAVSVHHRWEKAGRTRLGVLPLLRNYMFPTPVISDPQKGCYDVDRDGAGVDVELEHRYVIGPGDLEVRGGYEYHNYSSEGCEYNFNGHEFGLGLNTAFPFDAGSSPVLLLDAWGSFTYEPYTGDSAYGPVGVRREDHIWQAGAALEIPVTGRVSILARYSFVDNGSNVRVYDYDRHIVGGYIRVNLW